MKKFLTGLLLLTALVIPAGTAAAYDPLSDACQAGGDATSSSACNGTHGVVGDPNQTLRKVTSIIALIAGIAAVIMIIISGLFFVLSNGDAQKAATARTSLIGAIVGLVIIVAAQSLILFILRKV